MDQNRITITLDYGLMVYYQANGMSVDQSLKVAIVYGIIVGYCRKWGVCSAKSTTLMRKTTLTRSTYYRHLKRLAEDGFIVKAQVGTVYGWTVTSKLYDVTETETVLTPVGVIEKVVIKE